MKTREALAAGHLDEVKLEFRAHSVTPGVVQKAMPKCREAR